MTYAERVLALAFAPARRESSTPTPIPWADSQGDVPGRRFEAIEHRHASRSYYQDRAQRSRRSPGSPL